MNASAHAKWIDNHPSAMAVVRQISTEANSIYDNNRPGAGIAVGSEGERAAQKAEAGASFVRNIMHGLSPADAASAAKLAIRAIISQHNSRRKDANWTVSEGSYDAFIDGLVDRFAIAKATMAAS